MEVKLTPELERWVAEQVEAGRFADADAVVHAALLLLRREVAAQQEQRDALRRELQMGLDELDRGEGVDGEQAFEEELAWIAAQREQASEAA